MAVRRDVLNELGDGVLHPARVRDHHARSRARERIGDDRFIDIQYEDLTGDEMGVMRTVFDRMGQPMRPEDEAAMEQHRIDNKRDKWAPHIYDLETYGLSEEIIKSDFARYRAKHIAGA